MFMVAFVFLTISVNRMGPRNVAKLGKMNSVYKSSAKFLAVDSVQCWDAYQKVVTAVGAIPENPTATDDDDAVSALGVFATQCAAKVASTSTCETFVEKTALVKGDLVDFNTACAITEPKANAEGCSDAYDALIEALQPSTKKVRLHVAADEFNAFVTSCAKTAHEKTCFDNIKAISTENGPGESDLGKIQSSCNPSASENTGGGGDGGVELFSHSLAIWLLFVALLPLSYLI